jgi:phenylacetate-coenzyme A ligase PaaK-like adenylate-forming protein
VVKEEDFQIEIEQLEKWGEQVIANLPFYCLQVKKMGEKCGEERLLGVHMQGTVPGDGNPPRGRDTKCIQAG